MWKRVIRDYFAAFRWVKIKEAFKKGGWWLYPYFALILPACWRVFDDLQSTLQYFMVMLPILFGMFVSAIYPAVLPKIMYLCPMNKSTRKEYLEKSRMVRIMVEIGLSVCSIVIMVLLGATECFCLLAVFSNHFMFTLVLTSVTNEEDLGTQDANGNFVMNMDSKAGILWACMMVVVILNAFVQSGVNWGEASLMEGILLWVIPFALELPIVVWFCKRWPENVERALYYETAVKIVNKKKV